MLGSAGDSAADALSAVSHVVTLSTQKQTAACETCWLRNTESRACLELSRVDGVGNVCRCCATNKSAVQVLPRKIKTSHLTATELFNEKPRCSLIRTRRRSAAHCSLMSGELIIEHAEAGQDEAVCGGLSGGRGHQASANCKVKRQRESVTCCCTFPFIEQGAIDRACCLFVQMEVWCVSHTKVIWY